MSVGVWHRVMINNHQEFTMQTTNIIEIVSFKLAKGVSDEAFLKTIPLISVFLKTCDGFILRHLSRGDDGEWVDYVQWANMANAQSASQKFMGDKSLKPFMEKIESTSVNMRHNFLLHSETS